MKTRIINILALSFIITALFTSCEAYGIHAYIRGAEYVDANSFTISFGGNTNCLTKDNILVSGALTDGSLVSHTISSASETDERNWTCTITPAFASGESVTVTPKIVYWDCDLGHNHRLTGYQEFTAQ
ncbi:MAG: hypothetical protein K6G52_08830 [Treponemataceae bacterium]|nr:hypothetical protein [Treponemataceae bacterium]